MENSFAGLYICIAIVLIGALIASLWKPGRTAHNIILLCIVAVAVIGICILSFGPENWTIGILALLTPFAPVFYLLPVGIIYAVVQAIVHKVKSRKTKDTK